jgi:hypothetical protein
MMLTSCSGERPPKNTATRCFMILDIGPDERIGPPIEAAEALFPPLTTT